MTFDRNTGFLSARLATFIWVALIAALSVGGSLVFACAAPLVAIAALAGCKMERSSGLALVVAAWLSNQIVGYGVLHYPQTLESFAWGAAIGVAALVAYLSAYTTAKATALKILRLAAAFLIAFTAYELTLFIAGIPLGGSDEAFSMPVVSRIFEINLVSFVGLLILHRLAAAFIIEADSVKQSVSIT